MQDDISGWSEWDAAFNSIDELSSPSELHGILTGIICVTHAPSLEEWAAILTTLQIPALSEHALQLLSDEAEDVAAAIHDDALDYLPLLPDDQHSLETRLNALADWCAGVVLGFGLASGHLRQDEAELIEHLQDVAAVEYSADDADEDGELAFNEIFEFVRLIPVSLSTGRKKIAVAQSSLLKGVAETKNVNVVEMFTPHRPS